MGEDLMENSGGRIVSKAKSVLAKEYYVSRGLDTWSNSMAEARQELGIVEWVLPDKSGGALEKRLLKRSREIYEAAKIARSVALLQTSRGKRITRDMGFQLTKVAM